MHHVANTKDLRMADPLVILADTNGEKCGTYEDSWSENTLLYPFTLSKEKNNALERPLAVRLDKTWDKNVRQRNCEEPGID